MSSFLCSQVTVLLICTIFYLPVSSLPFLSFSLSSSSLPLLFLIRHPHHEGLQACVRAGARCDTDQLAGAGRLGAPPLLPRLPAGGGGGATGL